MDLDRLLHQTFTNPVRKGYVYVDGFTLPEKYQDLKNDINNLEVNEEDVWVCSFPKSGTTWTQEMVWQVINNVDFEKGKEFLDARSPFLEFSMILDYRQIMKNKPDMNVPTYRLDSVGYTKSQKSPVVIKSHLPLQLLPNQIKIGTKTPKIVYVSRDPKDTCVSYYHHARSIEGFSGTFEEFCELFLGGKLPYAPYWEHILPFWEMRNAPNVLFLRYEDMKQDLSSVIKKLSKFVNRSLSDEQVESLTKHLSFESMKNNPAVNKDKAGSTLKKMNLADPAGKFMRSGTVGDHKNSMSEEITKRFNEWIQNSTKGTDYTV